MRVWIINLRRTKSAIISWAGSFDHCWKPHGLRFNRFGGIQQGADVSPSLLQYLCVCFLSNYMSLVTKNPVFGVSNQVRLKSACSASETSHRLKILDIETRGIIISQQRITKTLIRLCGCAGWSAPLLFAYGKNRFSHDVTHMKPDKRTYVIFCALDVHMLNPTSNW